MTAEKERGTTLSELLVAAGILAVIAAAFFSALDAASRAERAIAVRAEAAEEAERILEHVAGALRRASFGTVALPAAAAAGPEVRFREVRAIEPGAWGAPPLVVLEPAETAFCWAEGGTLVREQGGRVDVIARGVRRFEVARLGASRALRITVEIEREGGGRGAGGAPERQVGTASKEVLVGND